MDFHSPSSIDLVFPFHPDKFVHVFAGPGLSIYNSECSKSSWFYDARIIDLFSARSFPGLRRFTAIPVDVGMAY